VASGGDTPAQESKSSLTPGDGQRSEVSSVERVIARIKEILEELTGRAYAAIDPDATFIDIGLDSLIITQLSRALQAEFKTTISFRKLMKESPTMTRAAQDILVSSPLFAVQKPASEAPAAARSGPAQGGDTENRKNDNLNAVYNISRPPVAGARLGRDKAGNPAWFIADEKRLGKFKKVEL
jgi:acyl carrier protein